MKKLFLFLMIACHWYGQAMAQTDPTVLNDSVFHMYPGGPWDDPIGDGHLSVGYNTQPSFLEAVFHADGILSIDVTALSGNVTLTVEHEGETVSVINCYEDELTADLSPFGTGLYLFILREQETCKKYSAFYNLQTM
ncbi:MAG: hypothetical protein IKG96_02440 [Bacteroidaceae bacterium]|nr:hypothetical protein [Bacteroidaceae bacterium]